MFKHSIKVLYISVLVICIFILFIAVALRSVSSDPTQQKFTITDSDDTGSVAQKLFDAHLIRSPKLFSFLTALVRWRVSVKSGKYLLRASDNEISTLLTLLKGPHQTVRVVVLEGATVKSIDALLGGVLIIEPGQLLQANDREPVEGKLFPDTYEFFTNSSISVVLEKFAKNFNKKALPALQTDKDHVKENIILASILEKEVSEFQDRQVVAGILKKRIEAHIPLQVDATICYIKVLLIRENGGFCYPLQPIDFKIDSPYNTYLHRGLPPGPIGSPGFSAISATVTSQDSPYWFYLNDPVTGKTIFAKTFGEHNNNRHTYLKL